MNFKNTYIKLKDSDKTVERIKEIADKYSRASGCDLEWYLKGDYSADWYCIEVNTNNVIRLNDYDYLDDSPQEITEQELDNYLSSQLPNNEEDAEECCEGGHCETNVKPNPTDTILNDVTKWGCFKEVADVLGEEDAEFELNKVKMKHLDGCENLKLDVLSDDLLDSFKWGASPQGSTFWDRIDDGELPDGYETSVQTPFKPTLVIDDDVLERMKGTFKEDDDKSSIGSLVEKLYTSLSPSDVTVAVNGTGQIVICGDKIPTVDVTKLGADDITKAYEAMVMLEGLFVDYEGEEL